MAFRILIIIIAIIALVGFSVLTAVCVCAGRSWVPEPSDCIIVLGAHVWMDGRLSNVLTYRLEAAFEAWRDGIAPAILVCGGQGDNEPEPEAAAMRRWLIEQGVPESAILSEDRSKNTLQNLINARAIMDERGMATAAICTTNYHLTRAMWLARDVGIDATGISAKSTKDPVSFVRGRLRETCSWILYFIRGNFLKGRIV